MTGQLSAYTTLETTERIVTQLANLQVRTDEQYNGLQGGLNTLERLYLRQLDQTADMVSLPNEIQNSLIQYIQNNVPQQLQQFLSTQQAEDRVQLPLLPGLPLFHQPASNWVPSRRIVKGLPRRARATSGPPDTPTRAGPSTIPVSPLAEKADVEMKDTGVSEGEHVSLCPGYNSLIQPSFTEDLAMEVQDTVQLPPRKRGRSIPATSSHPEDARFPQRTRSQSRSVVGPRIPFIHPPPTIPESPLAPRHSSPLSELEEVPGIAMSDILQDHVLE